MSFAPTIDDALAAPDFAQDPYPAYRRLIAHGGAYRSERLGGWIVAGFKDVMAALKDSADLSNRARFQALFEHLPPGQYEQARPLMEYLRLEGLIHSDPPTHTRLRDLLRRAFTPRVVEDLRPRVEEIVDELLTPTLPRRRMDVVADFAQALPAIVIAELLGVPREDRARFKEYADAALAFNTTGRPSFELVMRSQWGYQGLQDYLAGLVEDRRRHPREGLLGALVTGEADDRLTEQELVSTCTTLLIAGHETTTSLISNMMVLLLGHPEQLTALREDAALMSAAVEESLRYESPIQVLYRRATRDFEIGDAHIRQDEPVLLALAAANRDPAHVPDPDTFDIRRPRGRHLAFGQGIHFCLGAPLARLEAPIAIGAMLERMPNLRLDADEIDWANGKEVFRCPVAVPVAFDAR